MLLFLSPTIFSSLNWISFFDLVFDMAPNDPKQAAASGGGGFFASIASSLSNFGSAMSKSVNGYEPLESEFLKLINFFVLMVIFYNSFIWVSPDNEFTLFENFNTARCKRSLLWKIIFLN